MANGYIKRGVDDELLAWKGERERKVLLLRGARQVGKSSSVRNLAGKFEHFLEINFEKDRRAHSLFDGDLNVREICENLSILFKIPIVPGETLVFFDEIQSCPSAISSLRFFYEDYPELHLIAAGSLLEFALEELPSFGVGRIRSIFIIGGMPAVVADYVENGQVLNSQKMLNDLIISLKSDFSKYKKRVPDLQIGAAFDAAVSQSGGKFNYTKVEQLNYRQTKKSLKLLQNAGLLTSVVHSSANALPLGSEANFKKQKFILLDTGIFQRLLGLELSDILLNDDISLINKGAIAEQFAGLELIKSSSCYLQDSLYFWSREKRQSSAEVDYVVQRNGKIIPLEVKSGSTGQMQSMFVFLSEKKSEYGVRVSLENFSAYDRIRVYPLYAVGVI